MCLNTIQGYQLFGLLARFAADLAVCEAADFNMT